jgi:hypothetical protein
MDLYLHHLQDAIATAIRGMTPEELSRHPTGKWSVAEVLEHLYLTYTGTVKGFQRCVEAGRPMAMSPTLRQRLRTAVVVGAGYFPSGRKAPPQATPRGTPAELVLADIAPKIIAMDELITQCEARFGKQTKLLDHPILGPLTAHQWRKLHWVHGKHHMKQIWNLRKLN